MKDIIVDVDDVCLEFIPTLLRWYNLDYEDNLTPEDITDWDIIRFVKPQCGNNIYNYFSNPILYKQCPPVKNSLINIEILRNAGFNIYFATSVAVGGEGVKYNWLVDNGFLGNSFMSKKWYIEISSKHLLRGDFMVDDGLHNILDFQGNRILYTRAWNKKVEGEFERVNNWSEATQRILEISLGRI